MLNYIFNVPFVIKDTYYYFVIIGGWQGFLQMEFTTRTSSMWAQSHHSQRMKMSWKRKVITTWTEHVLFTPVNGQVPPGLPWRWTVSLYQVTPQLYFDRLASKSEESYIYIYIFFFFLHSPGGSTKMNGGRAELSWRKNALFTVKISFLLGRK